WADWYLSTRRSVTTTMRRSKSSPGASLRGPCREDTARSSRARIAGVGVCVNGSLVLARLVNLDHQGHSTLMAPHRERLSDVFVRQGIDDLEVRVGPTLHHATADLQLLVRIVEVTTDRATPGDRGACRAPSATTGANQEPIALTPNLDGYAVG